MSPVPLPFLYALDEWMGVGNESGGGGGESAG